MQYELEKTFGSTWTLRRHGGSGNLKKVEVKTSRKPEELGMLGMLGMSGMLGMLGEKSFR